MSEYENELASERAYVAGLYARLDAERDRALGPERLGSVVDLDERRVALTEAQAAVLVHVLDRAGVVPVSEGVELVAAPWFGKAPLRDLVADALEGLGRGGNGLYRQ